MYVHDSDAFVMLLCAILGIIHFVSSLPYGYLFHAKLLKNNSTIKYWSVFKEEQNANDLMTMTIMTMTLIDSQYAMEKARKAQKIFHKQQAFQIFCLSLHQSMCFLAS